MAVDYEEGRRLLANFREGRNREGFMLFMLHYAEALLNPVSAAPSPAGDEVEAIRARHEAALARMADNNWPMSEGRQDVAALLAMVDQMRVEK